MCATSITCGNPDPETVQRDEVHEARRRKESAAAARISSLPEQDATPTPKRAAARADAAPVKAAA